MAAKKRKGLDLPAPNHEPDYDPPQPTPQPKVKTAPACVYENTRHLLGQIKELTGENIIDIIHRLVVAEIISRRDEILHNIQSLMEVDPTKGVDGPSE